MVNSELPKDQIGQSLENSSNKKDLNLVSSIESNPIRKDSEYSKTEPKTNQNDFKKISSKIDEIENEVLTWRTKREELNQRVIDKAKSRNAKNKEVKNFIKIANDEKKMRDEINKKITEIKPQKKMLDEKIQLNRKILDEAEKKLENKSEPKSDVNNRRNSGHLLNKYQKEIKNLEWKLQTQTLDIREERMVVERIADLDGKFEELSSFTNLNTEKRKAYTNLRKNRKEIRQLIKVINAFVKESRIHHRLMIESYNKANSIRKKADTIHFEIQKVKKEADAVHNLYVNKIKEKRALSDKISIYKKSTRKEKEFVKEITKKKQASEALERSKDGKKISFEDFKSLIDRGLI